MNEFWRRMGDRWRELGGLEAKKITEEYSAPDTRWRDDRYRTASDKQSAAWSAAWNETMAAMLSEIHAMLKAHEPQALSEDRIVQSSAAPDLDGGIMEPTDAD